MVAGCRQSGQAPSCHKPAKNTIILNDYGSRFEEGTKRVRSSYKVSGGDVRIAAGGRMGSARDSGGQPPKDEASAEDTAKGRQSGDHSAGLFNE